jgi:hypothetical protein
MERVWCSTLAAMAIALGAQGVAAQTNNGLRQQLEAETAARQAMDANILDIVGQLTESDIVGRWAMTGSTMCLQSRNGFNADMSPVTTTAVSQLHGTVSAVRTFRADKTGSSVGVTQSLAMPQMLFGVPPPPNLLGGASLADLNAEFTWTIDDSGRLVIDDDNLLPQSFLLPESRLGFTVTIENVPSFIGHISKDKKTIVLAHATMAIETSVLRNPSGAEIGRTPRFCARERVLTRLAD